MTTATLELAKKKIAQAKTAPVGHRMKASFEVYPTAGEIFLFGEIAAESEGGIDAAMVLRALKAIGNKPARVYIDSVGGNVDAGISIYNLLESHAPGVTTIVSSLAASIASVILQAGQRRIVYSNSVVMVHSPMTAAYGNATDMRRMADLIDRYEARLTSIYTSRTGISTDRIRQMLKDETWFSGQEIVSAGFADVFQARASHVAARSNRQVAASYSSMHPEVLKRVLRWEQVKQDLRLKLIQLGVE